jgi:membrane protease YdiL (CAAX protease family)
MTFTRRVTILFGLLLTLGMGLLPLGLWGRTYSGLGRLAGNEIFWWGAVVLVLLYVELVEHRPLASIGFRQPKALDLLLAVIAAGLMIGGVIVIYGVIFPPLHLKMNTAEMHTVLQTPFWYRLLLVARAAVAEELLFRAYPIERLGELSGSRMLAAVVSVAAFTYAHLSGWGPAQVIVAAYGGVVLAVLYLWRRNLWANMLAHFLADGAGFLLP